MALYEMERSLGGSGTSVQGPQKRGNHPRGFFGLPTDAVCLFGSCLVIVIVLSKF